MGVDHVSLFSNINSSSTLDRNLHFYSIDFLSFYATLSKFAVKLTEDADYRKLHRRTE